MPGTIEAVPGTIGILQRQSLRLSTGIYCIAGPDLVQPATGPRSQSLKMSTTQHRKTLLYPTMISDTRSNSICIDSSGLVLTGLSATWFALCATLVKKHIELLAVFVAFVGSFGVAWILILLCACATKQQRHGLSHTRTKTCVGLITTTSALTLLFKREDFMALSVITGYLAFCLWYSSLYCSPRPPPIGAMVEDAVLLSLGVIVLSLWKDELPKYHLHLVVWTTHKTLRLLTTLFPIVVPITQPPILEKSSKQLMTDSPKSPTVTTIDNTWVIHGVSYDLTNFMHRHPGGREAIELGKGRSDCTALFESYHPFTTQHEQVLQKYKVGTQPTYTRDVFYDVLRERVRQTLQEHGLDPDRDRTAPPARVAYYMGVTVCLGIAATAHVKGSMIGSFFLAVFGWLIGALGHDAGHFAVSHVPLINDICVWAMSFLCNPILWQHQHTYAHHSHTNEFDRDPDLHHFTMLLKVHRRFQHCNVYKWQRHAIFVLFAYTFVVFGTCVWIPIGMLQEGSLYGLVEYTDRNRPWRSFGMMAHTVGYVGFIVLVPFINSSSWYKALACVILHLSTSGLIFGIFSQVNHLNEYSLDQVARAKVGPERSPMTTNSWAASQVETSNNFCTDSALWHILSNGLNLQIEHHLFPGLNHSHLHLIAPIVKATCEEYGVMYKTYNSWAQLMGATLKWLDTLSVEA